MVQTGRENYKDKTPIEKPDVICQYNNFMGGVDLNDQLLGYSPFSRRTLK